MNKEETLEEAAIRLYPDNIIKLGNETSYNAALLKRKDFIDGGNWVKERMYSEEEVLNILKLRDLHERETDDDDSFIRYQQYDEWFEQFKKK